MDLQNGISIPIILFWILFQITPNMDVDIAPLQIYACEGSYLLAFPLLIRKWGEIGNNDLKLYVKPGIGSIWICTSIVQLASARQAESSLITNFGIKCLVDCILVIEWCVEFAKGHDGTPNRRTMHPLHAQGLTITNIPRADDGSPRNSYTEQRCWTWLIASENWQL